MAENMNSVDVLPDDPVELKKLVVSLREEVQQKEKELLQFRKHRSVPATTQAITHKFDIAGHEGYITVSTCKDGSPHEVFITMSKGGSTIGGLMDTIGTLISLAIQHGVSVEKLEHKFAHVRFEPSGFTKNPDIPIAKSITDYLIRWMATQFIPDYR